MPLAFDLYFVGLVRRYGNEIETYSLTSTNELGGESDPKRSAFDTRVPEGGAPRPVDDSYGV